MHDIGSGVQAEVGTNSDGRLFVRVHCDNSGAILTKFDSGWSVRRYQMVDGLAIGVGLMRPPKPRPERPKRAPRYKKITPEIAATIRSEYRVSNPNRPRIVDLAHRYDVSKQAIHQVLDNMILRDDAYTPEVNRHRRSNSEPMPAKPRETIEDRIERRIVRKADTGCWVWTGHTLPGNQPTMSINQKSAYPSRYLYTKKHGDIPHNKWLIPTCGNRLCVNPDHRTVMEPHEAQRIYRGKGILKAVPA